MTIHPVTAKAEVWSLFAPYHYLTAKLNRSSRCWLVVWGDTPVAFTSSMTMPSGTLEHAWREHRTVVLPDYQGLGIGAVLGDWLGQTHLDQGHRFYSRTTHPRLARYRDESPLWRATKKSGKQRLATWKQGDFWVPDSRRIAYSFEYVGSVTGCLEPTEQT